MRAMHYGSSWGQILSFYNFGNPGKQDNHGYHGNPQVSVMKHNLKKLPSVERLDAPSICKCNVNVM